MSSTVQDSFHDIRALLDLIKTSIDDAERACITSGQLFPSLDTLYSSKSEAARSHPAVEQASNILIAAAYQLIATVRPPPVTLTLHSTQYHLPACLRVVTEAHVPEILRTAGDKGLHVKDIAAPTGIDAPKLARILRLLVIHHIFREVAPDTFAHNRISSCLDTGKEVARLLTDPHSKHDNTSGLPAIIGHACDEGFKSSAYLQEVISDPALTHSGDPTKTAFNRAFNTPLPFFEWAELPENSHRLRRFGIAMSGVNNMTPPTAVAKGFDWNALPHGSTVVDVGGGVGSQSLTLAKTFAHLKFIVQDRASVIEQEAPKFWNDHFPEAVSEGRIQFQGHDFFSSQKIQAPAVFMMRMILHDWSDGYCVKILSHLRAAAGTNTRLIIIDDIVTYGCRSFGDEESLDEVVPPPPAPLLPNYGYANAFSYYSDLLMLTCAGGTERTVLQFAELFRQAGWKLDKVHSPGGGLSESMRSVKIIAIPV